MFEGRPAVRFASWAFAPCLAGAVASSAWAAGGAHAVDDAAVEPPGVCHLEAWTTGYGAGRGLATASPGCTLRASPRLELGAGIQHLRDHPDDTLAGPSMKLSLRPVETGLGVGLAGTGAWSFRRDRVESASLIVPLTVPLGRRLRFNLNGGWVYARAARHRHEAFVGAQAEAQLAPDVGLMVEAFGRNHGRPGVQAGLRWTPRQGPLDLDLLVGRRTDGVSRTAVTLGLSLRR